MMWQPQQWQSSITPTPTTSYDPTLINQKKDDIENARKISMQENDNQYKAQLRESLSTLTKTQAQLENEKENIILQGEVDIKVNAAAAGNKVIENQHKFINEQETE